MASAHEPELLRSRSLLQAIIKDVPDAVILTSPQRRIVLANAAAGRIFDYPPEALVGQSTEIVYGSREDYERTGTERFGGKRRVDGERIELTLRRRSGELFDAEAIVTEIRGASGKRIGYLGIVRDVTARNAIAAELSETRRLLMDAVDALYEGLVIYDAEDKVVLRNRRFEELYPIASKFVIPGVRYEDALRSAVGEGQFEIPAGETDAWVAGRMANFRSPSLHPVETRLPGDRWTLVSTRRTSSGGTVASYVEITRRKRLESALTELTQLSGSAEGTDADRVVSGLGVGARYLGLPVGVVGCFDQGRFSVPFLTGSAGPQGAGGSADLVQPHVRQIFEKGVPLDFSGPETAAPGPAGCGAFIGTPLRIDGELYGAVCFVGPTPRPQPFDDSERRFVGVLADWIGGKIGRVRNDEYRRRLESDLIRLATTDDLTGIANRRAFMSVAERSIQHAERYERPLTLALADIDHFKKVNDTYGHAVGDAALRFFTETVTAQLRTVDIVGRLGGEEFALLLPETDRAGGIALIERIARRLREDALQIEGSAVRVTASFGLIEHRRETDIHAMLREADEALYEAKRTGRDKWVAR